MSDDFKVEYLPNGDFNVIPLKDGKPVQPSFMKSAENQKSRVDLADPSGLPPYVFDNAVVRLDGRSDVVQNTYHSVGQYGAGILHVRFKSGQDILFDEKRIQPPLGNAPSFISLNTKIELKGHTGNARDDGLWLVRDFYFSQREGDAQPRLHLDLGRRHIAHGFKSYLNTIFNANTVREQGGFEKIRLVKRIALKPQTPK